MIGRPLQDDFGFRPLGKNLIHHKPAHQQNKSNLGGFQLQHLEKISVRSAQQKTKVLIRTDLQTLRTEQTVAIIRNRGRIEITRTRTTYQMVLISLGNTVFGFAILTFFLSLTRHCQGEISAYNPSKWPTGQT